MNETQQKDKTESRSNRSNETSRRDDQGPQRRKTNREKRAEVHEVLTEVIKREARQQRFRDGEATQDDAREEAEAIQNDASTRSRQILSGR